VAAPVVGARVASPGARGLRLLRREPEKTALFKWSSKHLLTFEQQWTDKSDGHTLPSFVTDELHDFLGCGILARGLAQLFCPTLPRALCRGVELQGPRVLSELWRPAHERGALTLVDHVLPEVPIRQFVLTVPFPLRFPLAFDGKLLGQVLRIFTDTVAANYRKAHDGSRYRRRPVRRGHRHPEGKQ